MIIVWVFLAVGIAIGLVAAVGYIQAFLDSDFITVLFGGFLGLLLAGLIACAAGGVGFGIAVGLGHAFPAEYKYAGDIHLVALQDTQGVEGRFFLGSGSINSAPTYTFYYEDGTGAIKRGSIWAYGVAVYEEDREDAFIRVEKKDNIRPFGIEFTGDRYEVHVPKGTVLRTFKLDLE